jgi:hypothetical protein
LDHSERKKQEDKANYISIMSFLINVLLFLVLLLVVVVLLLLLHFISWHWKSNLFGFHKLILSFPAFVIITYQI